MYLLLQHAKCHLFKVAKIYWQTILEGDAVHGTLGFLAIRFRQILRKNIGPLFNVLYKRQIDHIVTLPP